MSNTEENLQSAFAGESQANRRYLFFADKAVKDGYPQAARLFRAVAEAETIHARNHFAAMDVGEHYEFTRIYPPFIEQAEIENNERAQRSFEYANEVEQVHHGLFEAAMKAFDAGQQLKDEPYFICPVCGNTVAGEAPEKCPICGALGSSFKRVE